MGTVGQGRLPQLYYYRARDGTVVLDLRKQREKKGSAGILSHDYLFVDLFKGIVFFLISSIILCTFSYISLKIIHFLFKNLYHFHTGGFVIFIGF